MRGSRIVFGLAAALTLGGCSGRELLPACYHQCERSAQTFESAEACRARCREAYPEG